MTEERTFTFRHFKTPGKAAQMRYEDRSPESWIRIGNSTRVGRASKRRRPPAWKSTLETLEGRLLMAIAAPGQPVAYLVNGFGGCCIPMDVRNYIQSHGGLVHISNWNDILNDNGSTHTPGGNPGGFPYGGTPDPFTDNSFVADAVSAIESQPASSPIILIGHSFGGDSILEVARALQADAPNRRIAVLATLDAVGRGGLRSNVTSPVPSNVDYFYNRWEQGPLPNPGGPPPPFDYLLSGHLTSNATQSDQREQSVQKTGNGKTKYSNYVFPRALSHRDLPNDAWVEKQARERLVRQGLQSSSLRRERRINLRQFSEHLPRARRDVQRGNEHDDVHTLRRQRERWNHAGDGLTGRAGRRDWLADIQYPVF